MADMFSMKFLVDFFNAYWFIIIPVVAALFVIIFLLGRSGKKKLKIYSRTEIEREKFSERMKHNKPDTEWFLYRGRNLIGRIIAIKNITIEIKDKGGIKNEATMQFVTKRTLFGWKVLLCFGRPENFIISTRNIVNDGHDVTIKIDAPLHNFMGINYDESLEDRALDFIKHDAVMRTEYEDFASVAYVKAMEQATLDPEHAHQTQQHQLDIEQEKEKRKRLVSG